MKKLLYLLVILFVGVSLASCSSDDDEPVTKGIKGIWMEDGNPESWSLLITGESWIWDDGSYGEGGASIFVPFINASYETLAKTFGPNDEFCLYRYDSKSDYYLVYSGEREDLEGNILFSTLPMLMRVSIAGDVMTISRFYISNYEDEEVASWFHNSAVTRAEIMSYKEYATLPNSVVIKEDEDGPQTYIRFK